LTVGAPAGLIDIAPAAEVAPGLELSDRFEEFTQAKSLGELCRLARDVITDPTFPTVRAWTRSGRGAVGCFPVYTPQELIHACGLLPVSLHGAGESLEISHADAQLGSFLCSISKSTLELALTDHLAPFSAFVFPYICDVSRNLEGIFPRAAPHATTHMLHLPQNLTSSATVPFLVHEYRRLLAKLERAGGTLPTPERLAASIELFNRLRTEIAGLLATQRDEPGKLSLTESYLLRRLCGLVPRELALELLVRARAEIATRPRRAKDGIRVLLVGPFCEQPSLDLIDLLEQVGCYVVDDELLQIHRWYRTVTPGADPLESLAAAYARSTIDIGVRLTPTTKAEAIAQKVQESRAQAVVFLTAKFCEPALEDVVLYRKALDALKVPYLHLEYEERSAAYDQSRLQLETFVESILFD
jgi:benzoyl-CoA reductase subunit C